MARKIQRRNRRTKKRSMKRRRAKKTMRRRLQKGGDGSTKLVDYDQMVVVAKPVSGERGDPDTIPTVMSKSAFDDQLEKDIDDMVPSA